MASWSTVGNVEAERSSRRAPEVAVTCHAVSGWDNAPTTEYATHTSVGAPSPNEMMYEAPPSERSVAATWRSRSMLAVAISHHSVMPRRTSSATTCAAQSMESLAPEGQTNSSP